MMLTPGYDLFINLIGILNIVALIIIQFGMIEGYQDRIIWILM
jgi:hypothetical protein